MSQSMIIESRLPGIGRDWTIEYVRTIDGSVFADRSATSQLSAFERALALIRQGYDVMRITEPNGRVIRADAIAEFYLTLSRRGIPHEPIVGESVDAVSLILPPVVKNAATPVVRRPHLRVLSLVVWIALSLAATAAAVATIDPALVGIVGPHGTVAAEPNYH